MKYLSVCSGIEAATVAWQPLGWRATGFSEIESFPSRVLQYHYQNVPNLGDMNDFKKWPDTAFDVLVGGTPCQSFSVAGLRAGLADPRGNLALIYLGIAQRYSPRWLVWENVPGVLSSNGGKDFGSIIGGMVELGYSVTWRVLDAQYFGVPQRRRRVFIVGYLGDWRNSAQVLFEPESLLRNPAPSREAGERVAPTISSRSKGGGGLGTDTELDGGLIPVTVGALTDGAHNGGGLNGQDAYSGRIFAAPAPEDIVGALTANGPQRLGAPEVDAGHYLVTHALRDEGFTAPTLQAGSSGTQLSPALMQGMAVRRLTPLECERLQGFPDGYTYIPVKKVKRKRLKSPKKTGDRLPKYLEIDGEAWKMASDSARYKALGNSMAVPVMRWIGERIAAVERAAIGKAAVGGRTDDE